MIHILLLLLGIYLVGIGLLFCAMLVRVSMKANKGMLLITIPALLVVGILTINFVCHMLHLPDDMMPHQKQIVNAINVGLQVAAVPLVLMKLYEIWSKWRANHCPKDAVPKNMP